MICPVTIPSAQDSNVKETSSELERGAEEETQRETVKQMKLRVWSRPVGVAGEVVSSPLYSRRRRTMQIADGHAVGEFLAFPISLLGEDSMARRTTGQIEFGTTKHPPPFARTSIWDCWPQVEAWILSQNPWKNPWAKRAHAS
jgi:hypothetical protein